MIRSPLLRPTLMQFGLTALVIALSGCSTPHGYGVDERAARTPDGSSGVVASAPTSSSGSASTAAMNQSTYLDLITQMQHEGQYFASLAHLDSYEARFGSAPETLLLRGDAARLTGQAELATHSYQALKATALAGAGLRGLSLLAGARGDFAAAADYLSEAVRLNSTDAVALSDLGYARIMQGDTAAARIPLMTAAQLAPANPKVMSNLALYLVLSDQQEKAEAVMAGAAMNLQTRHAIYAEAADLKHATPQQLANAGVASAEDNGSPLRVDFTLASRATQPLAAATNQR